MSSRTPKKSPSRPGPSTRHRQRKDPPSPTPASSTPSITRLKSIRKTLTNLTTITPSPTNSSPDLDKLFNVDGATERTRKRGLKKTADTPNKTTVTVTPKKIPSTAKKITNTPKTPRAMRSQSQEDDDDDGQEVEEDPYSYVETVDSSLHNKRKHIRRTKSVVKRNELAESPMDQSPVAPVSSNTVTPRRKLRTTPTVANTTRKSTRYQNLEVTPIPMEKQPSSSSSKKVTPLKIKLPTTKRTTVTKNKENNLINTPVVSKTPTAVPPIKRLKKVIGECPFPCREEQFQDIYGFLRRNLEQGDSRCMYVSGVPGTGKTAIVKAAVENLKESCEGMQFRYVYINGLSLSAPDKIWKRFWNEVDTKNKKNEKVRLTSDRALTNLRLYFELKVHEPVVLVVDELDQLMDKHQSILYTLLDWSNNPANLFSLICIFNTMNLPENALTLRNASRMGMVRSVFPPYTHEQLATIVATYIGEEGTSKLRNEALGLLCKKVAAISGDARRALEIAKRTLELLDYITSPAAAVQEAFKELFSSPKIQAVRSCSTLEKLILKTMCSELQGNDNSSNETKVSTVLTGVIAQAPYENLFIGVDPIFHCLRRLHESKLILIEHSTSASIHSKLSLNIAIPDVQFAMGIKDSDVDKF